MDGPSSSTDLVLLCFTKAKFDCDQYLLALRERRLENARLKRRAKRLELAKLEKLVADGEKLNVVQQARLVVLRRSRENQRLKRQAKRVECDKLEQLLADGEKLNDVQLARLKLLQSDKKRKNEADRLRYHAKRQKKADAACAVTDQPFKRRELDNSHACTLCNKLFTKSGSMKTHTSKFIPRSHFILTILLLTLYLESF